MPPSLVKLSRTEERVYYHSEDEFFRDLLGGLETGQLYKKDGKIYESLSGRQIVLELI